MFNREPQVRRLTSPLVVGPISLQRAVFAWLDVSTHIYHTCIYIQIPKFRDHIHCPFSAASLRPLRSLERHAVFVPRVGTAMTCFRQHSRRALTYVSDLVSGC